MKDIKDFINEGSFHTETDGLLVLKNNKDKQYTLKCNSLKGLKSISRGEIQLMNWDEYIVFTGPVVNLKILQNNIKEETEIFDLDKYWKTQKLELVP